MTVSRSGTVVTVSWRVYIHCRERNSSDSKLFDYLSVSMALQHIAILTVVALVFTCWIDMSEAVSGSHIAQTARSHVGKTDWTRASSHRTGANTNKCNIFVAEVLEEAGASVPHRRWWWSPIGAGEWGNRNSGYLTGASCWENKSSPQIGDVVGNGVHVGIVTGSQLTTSAPLYEGITTNNFGFRPSGEFGSRDSVTFWRYTC